MDVVLLMLGLTLSSQKFGENKVGWSGLFALLTTYVTVLGLIFVGLIT